MVGRDVLIAPYIESIHHQFARRDGDIAPYHARRDGDIAPYHARRDGDIAA